MSALCSQFQLLTVAMLGVFTGAMLTEAFVLVPWWRTLEPGEFFRWYAANDRRLLRYFGPVTTGTAVVAAATAVVAVAGGERGRWASVAASTLILVTVGMFFAYFEAANSSFSDALVPAGDLDAELARWARWHGARTAVSLAALASAVVAAGLFG